ncbi:hypothetical protein Tco_0679503 [Tanacetum coccineum]|uniref:Uncharacterized protein n=1 Tax=Tanacetum coccineum TaxID=301880 RepID=A0ABQ4XI17_9ASTR
MTAMRSFNTCAHTFSGYSSRRNMSHSHALTTEMATADMAMGDAGGIWFLGVNFNDCEVDETEVKEKKMLACVALVQLLLRLDIKGREKEKAIMVEDVGDVNKKKLVLPRRTGIVIREGGYMNVQAVVGYVNVGARSKSVLNVGVRASGVDICGRKIAIRTKFIVLGLRALSNFNLLVYIIVVLCTVLYKPILYHL